MKAEQGESRQLVIQKLFSLYCCFNKANMDFILMMWFVFIGVKMDVFVSSDYEQKQGGKIAGKSEDLSKHCWCRSRQRGMKLRLYYCMDYVKEWKSVTVELDDSIDEIAPGFVLSSFTTVTLEPIFHAAIFLLICSLQEKIL